MSGRTYAEKLKDPRWQKMRLEVLQRDGWECQNCTSTTTTLHVHHRYYERGADPWAYPLDALVTLCAKCHEEEGQIRPEVEQHVLRILRGRLFWLDLMGFADTLTEMPPEAVLALARGSTRGDWYMDAEGWMRGKREEFEAWERDYEARNKPE